MKAHLKLVIPFALLLAGCPVSQINQIPSTAPLKQPQPSDEAGEYLHSPSGYRFPKTVAGFARDSVMTYDAAGLNIGVGYNGGAEECRVALTIYAYPAPRMSFLGADPAVVRALEEDWLQSAYSGAKHEIEKAHPGAVLQSEDSKVQDSIPGKKAIYSVDATESLLFVFLINRTWFLKYRITYLAACEAPARQSIDAFFANWPGRDS